MSPTDAAIQPHAILLVSIVLAFGVGFFLGELSSESRRARKKAADEAADLAATGARYLNLRKAKDDRERRSIPSRLGADGVPAAERVGKAGDRPTVKTSPTSPTFPGLGGGTTGR